MKKNAKRERAGMWEVFDREIGETVMLDGRPLNELEEHEAQEAIQRSPCWRVYARR